MKPASFWTTSVYIVVMGACGLFVALTLLGMALYPGGTVTDHATKGYSFFQNFFSDLGLTVARNGQPNPVAAGLFLVALTSAGVGVILFFAAFPAFFLATPGERRLSRLGSAFGLVAGLCFIGVAFTPANLHLQQHIQFVLWAFRTLPVAVFLYALAILRSQRYPRQLGSIFIVYGGLLVLYLLLLEYGPAYDTPVGMQIQAVGQKIIVYASIISVAAQAWGARHFSRNFPAA